MNILGKNQQFIIFILLYFVIFMDLPEF